MLCFVDWCLAGLASLETVQVAVFFTVSIPLKLFSIRAKYPKEEGVWGMPKVLKDFFFYFLPLKFWKKEWCSNA